MPEPIDTNALRPPESRHVLGWLVLGLALVFYLLTLRPGHRAGDFAMYIQHTVNMAEGRPYAETTYVQNPAALSVGTRSYPPGLPLLLLPVYLVFGLNMAAMKTLMAVLFLAAIFVFWRLTRDRMAPVFAAVMLFDIVFTPYFWALKDNIESDAPFLLPVFVTLWLIDRSTSDIRDRIRWFAIGASMYAAVVIRPIGLALVIALFLYDLVDRKRLKPSLRFWIATATLVPLMLIQNIMLPLDSGSYASAFLEQAGSPAALIGSMVVNAKFYILACAGRLLLTNGHGTLWGDSLLVVSAVPLAAGFYYSLRDRVRIVDVFFVVYAGILLIWPFRQASYLIPVVPILSFYVLFGLQQLARRFAPNLEKPVAMGALVVLLLTFGMNYSTLDFKTVPNDVMSAESTAFFEYVKKTIPPEAMILSRVPREVAFFTRRRSTPPNLPADGRAVYSTDEQAQLFEYIDKLGIEYVAAGPKGQRFHEEVLPLWDLTERSPETFVPLFRNAEWRLYTVRPGKHADAK